MCFDGYSVTIFFFFIYIAALKSSSKDSSLEQSPGVLADNGPVYYILIGSSAAALLVFSGLLIYYVVAVRRQRKEASVPDTIYVDGEPKTPSIRSTRSDLPLLDFSQRPACLPMRPNGRKYSRDKGQSTERTEKKTLDLNGQCRHDNFYISPLRKK